jgi:plasmid stabilization system protein ParE
MNCGEMGSYKLTEDAQADLIRIHQHGVRMYGEAQADEYYSARVRGGYDLLPCCWG